MTEADKLREYIATKEKQLADLEAKYPGVRPGWVSEETTTLWFYLMDAKAELQKLEAEE
jgi:hypothetical protein